MTSPRPRPGILEIVPYVGGKAGSRRRQAGGQAVLEREPARAEPARRSRPTASSPASCTATPTAARAQLRQAIARRHNLDPDAIVCGAGSDELIGLLVRAYAGPGDEVLYSRHGFLMYPLAALAAGAHPVAAPERELTRRCRRAARARHLAHAAGLPRQPEQPDRQLPAGGGAAAAARRPARRRDPGDRRGLRRVCRGTRL